MYKIVNMRNRDTKTAIFITIRMDSSRLPNKTMRLILGKPVLEHIVHRAKLATEFDDVIVCTTERAVDDEVEQLALAAGAKVFRGSLEDKLIRWHGAAHKYNVDFVVTFDGDDLFCEPELLDMGARQIRTGKYDFIEAPEGLICGAFTYAFSVKALDKVCEIKASEDTEMMWTYFKDSGLFNCGKLENVDPIFINENYRLTLDYPEDYEMFNKTFEHFNCINNDVPLRKIIEYFEQHPEIPQINIGRQQEFLDNQKAHTHLELKSK